jgi:hypothetical protein
MKKPKCLTSPHDFDRSEKHGTKQKPRFACQKNASFLSSSRKTNKYGLKAVILRRTT